MRRDKPAQRRTVFARGRAPRSLGRIEKPRELHSELRGFRRVANSSERCGPIGLRAKFLTHAKLVLMKRGRVEKARPIEGANQLA